MDTNSPSILIRILRAVPSHLEGSSAVLEIAGRAAGATPRREITESECQAVLAFLDLFGVLTWDSGRSGCHLQNQVAHYFRESLIWYATQSLSILSNWQRSGVTHDIHISLLLETAPYFLRILEERRLALGEQYDRHAGASRVQPVSVVLLKAMASGHAYFLHAWDAKADQYQLIGGRLRDTETPLVCARREFLEEAGFGNVAAHAQPRFLPINSAPITYVEISPTYGALTEYRTFFFAASVTQTGALAPGTDWLSSAEMNSGLAANGRKVSQLFKRLIAAIPRALDDVPASPMSPSAPTHMTQAPPTIVYQPLIQSMVNSQLQMGTHHSSQVSSAPIRPEEVHKLLEALIEVLPRLELSPPVESELRAQFGTMNAQLAAERPSPGILKEAWIAARAILEHAAGHAAGVAAYHNIPELLARVSALLG